MRIHFISKTIITVFLVLALFQKVIHSKSLAKHRKFVKRELNNRVAEVVAPGNLTVNMNTTSSRRRFYRHYERYCDSRLRIKVANVCIHGYYNPESERVKTQRSTREILIRIPRNIRLECCVNECSDALILKYCLPTSAISTTTTTSTTTEHTHLAITESNSVDEENQINLETLNVTESVTSVRNLIVITDPPDDNIFAVNQQTNDVLNY